MGTVGLGLAILPGLLWGTWLSANLATLFSFFLIVPHYLILQRLGEAQTLQEHIELVAFHFVLCFITYALTSSYHLRKALALQLEQAEIERARFRGLFERSNDAVWISDLNMKIIDANDQALKMLGYQRSELIGMYYGDLVAPEEQEDFRSRVATSDRQDWTPFFERTYLRRDGSRVTTEVSGGLVRDERGRPLHYQTLSRDITQRKAAQDELYNRATHDELTGLYNRSMFFELLQRGMARANRNQEKIAILFFDLDGFKKANDTFGHHVGDLLLKAVAERTLALMRKTDTLSRIGGDEFTIILENAPGRSQVESVAVNVEQALSQPFALEGQQVRIGASVGIAIYPDDGDAAEHLVSMADGEMYRNKRTKYAKNLGWPLVF